MNRTYDKAIPYSTVVAHIGDESALPEIEYTSAENLAELLVLDVLEVAVGDSRESTKAYFMFDNSGRESDTTFHEQAEIAFLEGIQELDSEFKITPPEILDFYTVKSKEQLAKEQLDEFTEASKIVVGKIGAATLYGLSVAHQIPEDEVPPCGINRPPVISHYYWAEQSD